MLKCGAKLIKLKNQLKTLNDTKISTGFSAEAIPAPIALEIKEEIDGIIIPKNIKKSFDLNIYFNFLFF